MLRVFGATALALALLLGVQATASASAGETVNARIVPAPGESVSLGKCQKTFYIKETITLALAQRVLNINPSEYNKIELNSYGGSLHAAWIIAKFIRKNKLATHISNLGYCASACVLIFQAGVQRSAGEKALLMLHSATWKDGQRAIKFTKDYIKGLIQFGASPLLAKEFPTIGNWILTSAQASELGIVQTVVSKA